MRNFANYIAPFRLFCKFKDVIFLNILIKLGKFLLEKYFIYIAAKFMLLL